MPDTVEHAAADGSPIARPPLGARSKRGAPAATETVTPLVAPGTRSQIGPVNAAITAVCGAAIGVGSPNLFATIARHPRLFRRWMRFAGALMPGGTLPRLDTEIVIMRVAHLSACEYEWRHHERIAASAGMSPAQVAALRDVPSAGTWDARQLRLLLAVDEMFEQRSLSPQTCADLGGQYSDEQLIELLMLIGQYQMLAGLINSLAIQPDEPLVPRSAIVRALGRVAARWAG
jgi:alkylhydroperoxidase family enzyme